jgi:predicted DNA-binding ribbon-helix-helix protein
LASTSKRTTIYLEPDLYRTLRLKAVAMSCTVSALVNDVIKVALAEDLEDITAFEERAQEPLISYEEMIRRLKRDGRI